MIRRQPKSTRTDSLFHYTTLFRSPVDYAIRATPLPAGDPVGHYAPWRPARIEIPDARPHPDQLVESVAMASVLPPAPSYRPMFQPQASSEERRVGKECVSTCR